jgi:hypothetical protein
VCIQTANTFLATVAHHHFAVEPHTRVNELGLAVAVGGLIEIHEVYVDGVPGQVAVKLEVMVGLRAKPMV